MDIRKNCLSIIIPAHNESHCIYQTVVHLHTTLKIAQITHEILVVNDHSTDNTQSVLEQLKLELPHVFSFMENQSPPGFGFAIRTGLENFKGDVVATVMADGSDGPQDVVRFFQKIEEGYECVFGSRFIRGGKTVDYPWTKLLLNRFGNLMIQILFQLRYNDITNAFKMYRRNVIDGLRPFLSHHFNLTVELPLKAIVRGYTYAVVPNQWVNRKTGISKFKIKEMGGRYLFIMIYCFIEKWLSAGDYRRKEDITKELAVTQPRVLLEEGSHDHRTISPSH